VSGPGAGLGRHVVRVACAQLAPVIGDAAGNAARALEAIRTAAAAGARVVVLPELALSGYVFDSVDEARALATPVEALATWGGFGAVVVGGFCELGGGGRLFNSAAVVDGSGVRAVYRKAHLWDREPTFFGAGDAAPPVVETAHGRVSTMVCFDLFFPEWVRVAALAGAQLLCVPGNWPREPRPPGERPVQLLRAMVAAEAGGMAVATCDRCGTERGADWAGATCVAGPDGSLLAAAPGPEPALVVADVELLDAGPPWLAARRPELYGPLLAGGGRGQWPRPTAAG
jgi:5-aminopentanamidase